MSHCRCAGALLVISVTLLSCAHRAASSEARPDPTGHVLESRRVVWAAMGTVWTLDYTAPRSIGFTDTAELEETARELVYEYDIAFSDWDEESELRRLETRDLTRWQEPSELFLRGLKYSQEAFVQTNGAFDITIGAVQWKALKKPVGTDKLRIEGRRFRFTKNPKRLTFGGIAKGMAVGAVVSGLLSKGLHDFRLDAGGGNLALAGFRDGQSEPWPEAAAYHLPDGQVWHISRSRTLAPRDTGDDFDFEGHVRETQHIWDPHNVNRHLSAQVVIVCGDPLDLAQERPAAFADVFSKVALVKPKFTMPAGCSRR